MIIKKIILLLLFLTFLFSFDMNSFLIIESKLYPRIIKLNRDLENKERIKIAIIYNEESKDYAYKLKRLLKNYFVFTFDVKNLSYKLLLKFDVIILGAKIDNSLLNKLINSKKFIFSLYPNDVSNAMVGIYVGARVVPFINPYLIKKAKIKIDPIIFAVSKIYEGSNDED
jgi:hypothetical protein